MNPSPDGEAPDTPHIFLVVHGESSGCSIQGSDDQRRQFAHVNEAIRAVIDSFAGAPGKITVVDERNVQILTVCTASVPWLHAA